MKCSSTLVASLLFAALLASPSANAQIRHSGGAEGGLLIIDELGVVAGPGETKGLEIMSLLPDTDSKREIELKRGDQLLMLGGKRMSDIGALRAAYEGAEVGDTVKLGIRRGDERFLVSFEKKPASQGGRRMVMMRGGPGDGGGDMQPLMEFGVVLTENDGKVVVGMEIPGDEKSLAKDDVVTAVNGTSVDSIAAFRKVYEALAIGDDMDIAFSRAGSTKSLTRAKAEASGAVRMRQAH
jgi:S1-C subfamily serine protease